MSISVSRWNFNAGTSSGKINFSLQYVLDCDLLGDACVERTPLSAYQIFWKRHPPNYESWDQVHGGASERKAPTDPPRSDFDPSTHCLDTGCYPGATGCTHHWALTGSCDNLSPPTGCPVYMLYNWRWIKSHLLEVGAVTSSVIVHSDLFPYKAGVYSAKPAEGDMAAILGMLDVTIIGWGQEHVNLSAMEDSYSSTKVRWWWVIPHFGGAWGEGLPATQGTLGTGDYYDGTGTGDGSFTDAVFTRVCKAEDVCDKGLIRWNRRFDDCNIESHAVGAVPHNFIPLPHRTPGETTDRG